MDSHVVELRADADAAPGVLKIGQVGTRLAQDAMEAADDAHGSCVHMDDTRNSIPTFANHK